MTSAGHQGDGDDGHGGTGSDGELTAGMAVGLSDCMCSD